MKKPSESPFPQSGAEESLFEQILGFGDNNFRKSHYPELQNRLEELERFRAVLDQTSEAIFLLDPVSTGILDANESAANQLKTTLPALQGLSILELLPEEIRPEIRKALDVSRQLPNFMHAVITSLVDPWAGRRPVEITFRSATQGDQTYVVAVARDVTERLRAEKAMTEFLMIASHELRTPVTALRLTLELANRAHAAGRTEGLPSLLERMDRQSVRLTTMINELLDLSRLEQGEITLNLAETDLGVLVRETLEDYRMQVPRRRVGLECPTCPLPVRIDGVRIAQVLDNLLDNAQKYSPEAEPIDVHVDSIAGNRVRIAVCDRGPGISPEEQQLLFKRFYRSRSDIVRTKAGLGLGLYISKELVKRHGGELRIESQAGQGSTFYFDLPLNRSCRTDNGS